MPKIDKSIKISCNIDISMIQYNQVKGGNKKENIYTAGADIVASYLFKIPKL